MKPLFEVMDELQLQSFSLTQQNVFTNHLYAVIEGAKAPEGYQSTGALIYTLENTPSADPLFLSDELIKVSPWLVEINPLSPLFNWLIDNACNHPFVLIWSSRALEQVKPFMVNLLKALSPNGESLFFRYYHPDAFNLLIEYNQEETIVNRLGEVSGIATYSANDSRSNRAHWRVRTFKSYEKNSLSIQAIKPTDIKLNQQEWKILCDYKRETSLKQMGLYLQNNYPDHLKNIDAVKLRQFVGMCITKGENLGFYTKNELEQWLDLSLFFGECFVDNHNYTWAKVIAGNKALSPTQKLQQLNQYLDFYQARSAI